jgi:hypothetical protein
MAERLVVAQQQRPVAGLGDQDIQIAVAVDVGVGGAAAAERPGEVAGRGGGTTTKVRRASGPGVPAGGAVRLPSRGPGVRR